LTEIFSESVGFWMCHRPTGGDYITQPYHLNGFQGAALQWGSEDVRDRAKRKGKGRRITVELDHRKVWDRRTPVTC